MSHDVESLMKMIQTLQAQVEELIRLSKDQQATIERQKAQIDAYIRMLYGRKSEKMDPNQTLMEALILDVINHPPNPPSGPVTAMAPEEPVGAPARRARAQRAPIPAHLERRETILRPESTSCECCGKPMKEIGEDVTEKLDYTPEKLHVNRTVRVKLACADSQCAGCGVKTAPIPNEVLPKVKVDAGLLAQIVVSKYHDHLTLYRLEGILERHGMRISRQTQCDWVQGCAEVLEPLYREAKRMVLQGPVVLNDDTPVDMLDPGRGKTRQAHLWVSIGGADQRTCVFDFTTNRSHEGPLKFFQNYAGHVLTDAFGGYEPLFEANPEIIPAACWTHGRRYFHKALSVAPGPASEMIAQIRQLYQIEKTAREMSATERARLRQEEAAPLLVEIRQWLDAHEGRWLPKSPMDKAIQYARKIWPRLCAYLLDGRVPIDNNAAERAIRPVAIGRKNWMFFGSESGGRAAAILMSIMQTCRLNQIDPWHYLRDVLSCINDYPAAKIGDLMPAAWKAAHSPA